MRHKRKLKNQKMNKKKKMKKKKMKKKKIKKKKKKKGKLRIHNKIEKDEISLENSLDIVLLVYYNNG